LLRQGDAAHKRIPEMMRINELALRSPDQVRTGLLERWQIMNECIERGLRNEGILPGGLNVRRRAKGLHQALLAKRAQQESNPTETLDWVSLYAIAVNEENAAGGRVVTAPTNGAAGIIPAVIRYYREFYEDANEDGIVAFLLTAAAIGGLCKRNASLSGAEVGCQGEVGVACSMAAAGLAAALGGSNAQIENAAEIGIEHHLGMSCDPVGGLVQIPCIERNAMGAIKAINAASLALRGDGAHRVPLDAVIKTMYETGRDMMAKYKETSLGGLAVNVVDC
jgi:L-serine dehydratase